MAMVQHPWSAKGTRTLESFEVFMNTTSFFVTGVEADFRVLNRGHPLPFVEGVSPVCETPRPSVTPKTLATSPPFHGPRFGVTPKLRGLRGVTASLPSARNQLLSLRTRKEERTGKPKAQHIDGMIVK